MASKRGPKGNPKGDPKEDPKGSKRVSKRGSTIHINDRLLEHRHGSAFY